MKLDNFISSWVKSIVIDDDTVIVECENKDYVMRRVSADDRLRLIETAVNNANGDDVSVGSEVHDLFEIYEPTELCAPVIDRLTASTDTLYFDGHVLAHFHNGEFIYTGLAASDFFKSLLKELNGTK